MTQIFVWLLTLNDKFKSIKMSHVPVSKELRTAIEHFYEYILTSTKSALLNESVYKHLVLINYVKSLSIWRGLTLLHTCTWCTYARYTALGMVYSFDRHHVALLGEIIKLIKLTLRLQLTSLNTNQNKKQQRPFLVYILVNIWRISPTHWKAACFT